MAVAPMILMALLAQGGECHSVLEQARHEYNARHFDVATAGFHRALNACPDTRQVLLPLAQSQMMEQHLEESRQTLSTLLRLDPLNADALKLQGDVLYILGKESEAQAVLQRALQIDPEHGPSQYTLARIYYQQNRITDARALFLKLIRRNEDDYRAHDNLALCYAAEQKDSDAIRHFVRALDLVHQAHPEYDVVYANFAYFLLERSEFEKAFQLAAEAAERNPRSARNYFLTGKALVKLEKLDLSVRWLEQSAQLDPTYTEPRYWLAQVYRKLGKHEEARRELEIFRELSKAPKLKR